MWYIIEDMTQQKMNSYSDKEAAKKDLVYFKAFASNNKKKNLHYSVKEDKEIAKQSIPERD